MSRRAWKAADLAYATAAREPKTYAEIAADLGRTEASVRAAVNRKPPKPKRRLWSPHDLWLLDRLHEQGEPIESIAAALKRSPGSVRARLATCPR